MSCSTTLFANPQCHNLAVHPDEHRAAFLASSKHLSGLCQTSCLQLVNIASLRPTAGRCRPAPHCSCGIFFKIFSCCCSCQLSPVSFLVVSDISALLVVRVVSVVRVMRFVINSSKTEFSFVAAAARLSKYPSSATRPSGVLFLWCNFPWVLMQSVVS